MALTKEDLQAIGALLEPIKTDIKGLKSDVNGLKSDVNGLKSDVNGLKSDVGTINTRLDRVEDTLQTVKNSQIQAELIHLPQIAAALDGHKLNSEKLDAIQKNLEDITPTVQALEILHHTGYAK